MSNIEWTDQTWNPVVGCTPVSPGCLNCYAATMARRLEAMGRPEYAPRTLPLCVECGGTGAIERDGVDRGCLTCNQKTLVRIAEVRGGRAVFTGEVRCLPGRLEDPFSWRKPRRVFVNSMSDLFHEAVPFEFIDQVFAVMALCPQHTFQVLTKRPERMREYFHENDGLTSRLRVVEHKWRIGDGKKPDDAWGFDPNMHPWPLPNVWLGTSVENQKAADERIPHLLACPAAVRFLSCEPLLDEVDLTEIDTGGTWPFKSETSKLDALRGFSSSKRDEPDATSMSRDGTFINHGRSRYVDRNYAPVSWVIVGGESGPGARACDVLWIESIIKQCREAGVACFVKQLGSRPMLGDVSEEHGWTNPNVNWNTGHIRLQARAGNAMGQWPEHLRVRQMPGGAA